MGKILRRTFLIGSAAIAGGVAFGTYVVRKPHDNPLLGELGDDETTFNPWVKISPDGITLIAPHTDLGQGARSIQAAFIAEEMDLDFGQFSVEPGPPAAAYYNTATADETAPFRARDHSFPARLTRSVIASMSKVMGVQVTGGSSTVPDVYERLRSAGAVARETLKLAAAREYDVDVSTLSTRAGAVRLPDGKSVPYVELASAAATIEPVVDVPLRDPAEWRLIGKEMQRLDIVGKSTGTLDYGIDLEMEGMVHATVRLNPRQGAAINGFDASEALRMRGVKSVFEVTNGIAVIADNTWHAFKAANAVEVDWAEAPYPASQADHWLETSAAFAEDHLDNEWRNDGDAGDAVASGDTLEFEYRAPYLAHAPLEPIGAVCVVNDGRVDIWVSHQMPRFAQQVVADAARVDIDSVHLHNQYCGGSFGHRLEFENVRYAAEIAATMPGTPVKLTFSREEDFAQDFVRQNGICRATGKVSDAGIDTLDISVAAPSVLASQFGRIGLPSMGPDTQIPAGVWDAPYAIPNMRMRAYAVPALAPTSSWRSVGASTGGFYLESAIDELCHAAGADPLEERIRLCDDELARNVLQAAGESSGWGSNPGPNRGRGIAMVYSFGVYVAEVVEVTNTARGIRIDKVWVAADVGRIADPINFDNHVKGAVVWGLGHAMNCEITYADGMKQQTNFHVYQGMRMHQCPQIEVIGLENDRKIRGIGEPPVPPAAPALANAIFAATGTRLREMPFNKFVDFV